MEMQVRKQKILKMPLKTFILEIKTLKLLIKYQKHQDPPNLEKLDWTTSWTAAQTSTPGTSMVSMLMLRRRR